MRHLTLTHAWSRLLYGTRQYNPPSRFFKEIPDELMQTVDGSRVVRSALLQPQPARAQSRPDVDQPRRDRGAGPRCGTAIARALDRTSGAVEIVARALDAGRRPAPSPSGADRLGLRVGDDVRHAQWGEGVIVDIKGAGDSAQASVCFSSVGEKQQLLLSWAPLERI